MLYRYFEPHFNPRLRLLPIRYQELGELEQAALELRKAIRRARVRTEISPVGPINSTHFDNILAAVDYTVDYLGALADSHPGDNDETLRQLLEERREFVGWDNWVKLVCERMDFMGDEASDTRPSSEMDEVRNAA